MTNEEIAGELRQHAAELSRIGTNLYRVRSFRQAALTVLALPTPIETLLATVGREGLQTLPGIGRSIAETIESIVSRHHMMQEVLHELGHELMHS